MFGATELGVRHWKMWTFLAVATLTILTGFVTSDPVNSAFFALFIAALLYLGAAVFVGLRNGRYPIFFIWEVGKAQKIEMNEAEKRFFIRYPMAITVGAVSLLAYEAIKL